MHEALCVCVLEAVQFEQNELPKRKKMKNKIHQSPFDTFK